MLITDLYRSEQAELHGAHDDYGSASVALAPTVGRIVRVIRPRSVLDYGAGKQRLIRALPELPGYRAYDPALAEIAAEPEPADLVVCLDVLEHIEPGLLPTVLDHIAGLARPHLLASVSTRPARRVLSDGRNAHLIQQPPEWWLPQIWPRLELTSFSLLDGGRFWIAARRR